MKQWLEMMMTVCVEDGIKLAVEYQNGTPGMIERYMLKPATKTDSEGLREVEEIK